MGHVQKRFRGKTGLPEEQDLCRWQRSSVESEVEQEVTLD